MSSRGAQAGELREVVAVEFARRQTKPSGEVVITYAKRSTIRCKVEQVQSKEVQTAGKFAVPVKAYRFTTHATTIANTDRVNWQGRQLYVYAVDNPPNQRSTIFEASECQPRT